LGTIVRKESSYWKKVKY